MKPFNELMMNYSCAMREVKTKIEVLNSEFEARFRRRFAIFHPFLEECQTAGYALCQDGRWLLTPGGFLVSNQIITRMLDILAENKRRRAEAASRGDFRVTLD